MSLKYTSSLPCLGKCCVDFRDASSNRERTYVLASPSPVVRPAVPADPYISQDRVVILYSNHKYHWHHQIWKLNGLMKDCQSYQKNLLYWGVSLGLGFLLGLQHPVLPLFRRRLQTS